MKKVISALALSSVISSPLLAEKDWTNKISLYGSVDTTVTSTKDYAGTSSSDLTVSYFELGVEAQVNEMTSAEVLFVFEEDYTPLDVDYAVVTIGKADGLHYKVGKMTVPFGKYSTALYSSPVTKSIGKAKESALTVGWSGHGAGVSAYVFNGDARVEGKDDTIGDIGAQFSYGMKTASMGVNLTVGYIGNIADSNGTPNSISVAATDDTAASVKMLKKAIPGLATALSVDVAGANISFETVMANDKFESDFLAFKGEGAKPSAWHGEVSYGLEVGGKMMTLALAAEASEESLALGLAKSGTLVGFTYGMAENVSLGFEHRMDTDYAEADGGTGKSSSNTTINLSSGF